MESRRRLLIKDLKPSLNGNVATFSSLAFYNFPADFDRSVCYQFFTIVFIRFQSWAFKSYCIVSNRLLRMYVENIEEYETLIR